VGRGAPAYPPPSGRPPTDAVPPSVDPQLSEVQDDPFDPGRGHAVSLGMSLTARMLMPGLARCFGARAADPSRRAGGCGNPLFLGAQVFSTGHAWQCESPAHAWDGSFFEAGGEGFTEHAFLVNAVVPGSVALGGAREVEVAQGRMEVRQARCAECGSEVGWRFERDLSDHGRAGGAGLPRPGDCAMQLGRYGVVVSAWTGWEVPVPLLWEGDHGDVLAVLQEAGYLPGAGGP